MRKFKVYFWKTIPNLIFKEIKNKYKNRQRDYMNAYICDTMEEMYNLCDKLEKDKLKRDYGARTYCFAKNYYDVKTNKYIKTSPMCGHMVFNSEYFTMNSIVHESTHAVIGYFNRKLNEYQEIFMKSNEEGYIEDTYKNETNEELFCYMLGSIADQIVFKSK